MSIVNMSNRAAVVGAVVAGAVALGATTVWGLTGAAEEPEPSVIAPEGASPTQRSVVEAIAADEPIPVVDHDGISRGFVRDSELTARDDRILARLVEEYREPVSGPEGDEEYDALFNALRVLDPVEVTDETGDAVGYWTDSFTSFDDHASSIGPAERLVDELLR